MEEHQNSGKVKVNFKFLTFRNSKARQFHSHSIFKMVVLRPPNQTAATNTELCNE